jgi:DNA invertase Pin-like site-specific DNA recombinase
LTRFPRRIGIHFAWKRFDPFILHLYAALAAKERRLILEITKAGLRAARAPTSVSVIHAWRKIHAAHNARAAALAQSVAPHLRHAHKESAGSLGQIANALSAKGITPALGGR